MCIPYSARAPPELARPGAITLFSHQEQAGAARSSPEAARSGARQEHARSKAGACQEQPEAARSRPGATRSSPGAVRSSAAAARSGQEQPAAASSSKDQLWEPKKSILHNKNKGLRAFDHKSINISKCFIRVCENNVAVTAAALMGGPPNCSHSNIIFVNVDISKVLATFFANAAPHFGPGFGNEHYSRQNPIVQALFGE